MIAAFAAWHDRHDAAARALADVTVLPAHVILEAYAVLTRLPAGLAVPASVAAGALSERFAEEPLRLADSDRGALLHTLAAAGVYGGASYDALIALEAHAHGHVLLSLDRRAQETYRRLRIAFRTL